VTGVAVRRAEPDDFDAWFELFDEVAKEGRWIGSDGPQDREVRKRRFLRHLGDDQTATFVVELDGQLVGELSVFASGGVADLGMLVRDGHRGQGVGSALMASCIEWCRAAPVHKVALEVFPHNAAGLALYRGFGFQVEGRRVRHHRRASGQLWDSIVMGLVLDESSPGCPYDDVAGDPGR